MCTSKLSSLCHKLDPQIDLLIDLPDFDLPLFEQYNCNIGNDQSKQKTIGIAHLEPKVVILATQRKSEDSVLASTGTPKSPI